MRIRKKRAKGSYTSVPMTPRMREALERQREAFKAKFGREPSPNDPVFFDPTADHPKEINAEWMDTKMSEAMRRAGIPEDKIYAWEKTGFIVTKDSPHTDEDIAEWNAAIEEYWARQRHDG
jgi:hypothetical protein